MVSFGVTPMCRKMLLSSTMPQKHSAILEGLLKVKRICIPTFAVNSQIKENLKESEFWKCGRSFYASYAGRYFLSCR